MIDAVVALGPTPGLSVSTCAALSLWRASVYRQRGHSARPQAVHRSRPQPRRALATVERQIVLDLLHALGFRVVGWCAADRESATLLAALFEDATTRTTKHPAPKGQLTLHADRGGPIRAKATALLLADLGVTKFHSRPHTSNDNPFSESHFKTMKYQPQLPQGFGCIQDAKTFWRSFFDWYNQDHHHAGASANLEPPASTVSTTPLIPRRPRTHGSLLETVELVPRQHRPRSPHSQVLQAPHKS